MKNKDVDEISEGLADEEEVPSQIINMEPALEELPTASTITVDDSLVSSSGNAMLRSNEKTQTVNVEGSPKRDRKLSDKTSAGNNKQNTKDNEAVKKYATEVIDTDEFLIITLSASRRRKLPKTKQSQELLIPESSENNPPSSKVTASDLASYKTTLPKCTLSEDLNLASQPSEIQSTESKRDNISSKSSKVSSEYSDSTSTDTSTSVESYKTASECIEVYKAKTPSVLYNASEATTKYPDGEFYAEIRNHTTPTKWNNPVYYNNRYPIYFNPARHFPPLHKPNTIRKNATIKIPKKFATFLLRVLKNNSVHEKTENISKTERSPGKSSVPHVSCTEELGKPLSTSSPASKISTLANIDSSAAGFIYPISSTSTTETLEKPSTMKHRQRYSASASEADILLMSTRTKKHIDQLVPKSTARIQTHSSITTAQPVDPLTMNPIKFREKLRKLSNSESSVQSPGVQKKGSGSKYKTRAIPKTRAEPTKDPKSKIGSISNVELSNDEGILVWTTPESGSVPKDGALVLEKAISKKSKKEPKKCKSKEVPKNGGTSKSGSVLKSDALPKNEGKTADRILNVGSVSKVESVPKIGAVQTEKIPKGVSAIKGDISNNQAIPAEEKIPRYEAVHKEAPTSKSENPSETEATSKSETSTTRTVLVLPQEGYKSKTCSKTQSATKLRKGQYRDIPVIAYVRRAKRHPPKTNLAYYLPKEDGWIRFYWRKFKYFQRIESERQQSLLQKIVSSLNQIDLSLQSAYNYSNSIEKLRQVTCDMDDFLRYRNNKMKWLMGRLMHKTEIISDFLETIRCDVVLYTLETSASNDITSKRLYKLLKYLCGKEERKRKSEGKLTPVEEEGDINTKHSLL